MRSLDYILLAVRDPLKSAGLYSKIGLWAADEIEPKTKPAGGAEISFTEPDKSALLATHDAWRAFGLTILQPPTEMDFGFTFTAEDPDGHRLRPFVPAPR
jgi:hypothetical protein